MKITESEQFKRDFKKLQKKYRTLGQDFEIAKKAIATEPTGDGSKHWNILRQEGEKYVLKTRMACRAVKKGPPFRLIYLYDGESIELFFIEIYFKGDKERENEERIKKAFD